MSKAETLKAYSEQSGCNLCCTRSCSHDVRKCATLLDQLASCTSAELVRKTVFRPVEARGFRVATEAVRERRRIDV